MQDTKFVEVVRSHPMILGFCQDVLRDGARMSGGMVPAPYFRFIKCPGSGTRESPLAFLLGPHGLCGLCVGQFFIVGLDWSGFMRDAS